jgi:hypothetical protein
VRYQAVSPIVVLANALESTDELLSLFVRVKFFIDQDRVVSLQTWTPLGRGRFIRILSCFKLLTSTFVDS